MKQRRLLPQEFDDVRRLAKDRFAFLEARGAARTVEDSPMFCVLSYAMDGFTIEVELDWQEQQSFVLLYRPGEEPDGNDYYLDARGRVVRIHLAESLERLGLIDSAGVARLKQLAGLTGVESMRDNLERMSVTLQEVYPALASRIDTLFGGANH